MHTLRMYGLVDLFSAYYYAFITSTSPEKELYWINSVKYLPELGVRYIAPPFLEW